MTYQPMFVAYLNSFSALRYNYNGHRESYYCNIIFAIIIERQIGSPLSGLVLSRKTCFIAVQSRFGALTSSVDNKKSGASPAGVLLKLR